MNDDGGTITTGPNGQLGVDTDGQYGINAVSDGVGIVSVTMSADSTIDANGSGIFAENGATTIPSDADAGAGSSITVTAEGTINSGTNLTQAGNPPAGILAGYNSDGEAEPNVNGTVTVNNFGNITALGGDGIRAFNFGEGDVTVNENYGTALSASTAVSGVLDGIVAEALSGGTGNVTVNVGPRGEHHDIELDGIDRDLRHRGVHHGYRKCLGLHGGERPGHVRKCRDRRSELGRNGSVGQFNHSDRRRHHQFRL